MTNPKYPQNLSTILEANSNSLPDEKEREGWIMSVSKTFCGATGALMAADGKFGGKGLDATLLEVLQEAERKHPERIAQINDYRKVIEERGFGNITMSELLSHRSGLVQGKKYFDPGDLSNIQLFESDIIKFDADKKGKVFSYCNPGFVLAEDMMSLVSDHEQEGYYAEVKNRIIEPLDLKHTKSIYESEDSIRTASEVVQVEGVVYDWGIPAKETSRISPLEMAINGKVCLSEGGLSSNINDLEKFYRELAKAASGIPSQLVPDQTKAKAVQDLYLGAYKAGEECESASTRSLSRYVSKHYSLGVIIGAVDEQGKLVDSRKNPDARVSFQHLGNMPGNSASANITMPFSFADLMSGNVHSNEKEPELDVSIAQQDVLVKDSLLTQVSYVYTSQMDKYFSDKCDKETDANYNDIDDGYNYRTYNQYWEAARTGEYVGQKWQAELVQEGKLASNFAEYHAEIFAAYEPARQALTDYVSQNYLGDDGIINSDKVKEDFATAEKFQEVQKILEPELTQAREQTADIFAKADQRLEVEQQDRDVTVSQTVQDILNTVKDNVLSQESAVEKFCGDRNSNADETTKSWVDRVSESGSKNNKEIERP